MSPHGTESRYVNGKCRCEACRAANTANTAHRRERRRVYVQANGLPSTIEHGASAYRNWGCRCSVCTAAESARSRNAYNKARQS